ncbi:TIGR04197 family type VII secretion effector [Enterococcus sp. BWR-S5]|uniref:TIGR04197 family type VII secretion effector n=1 Tax=Enterococcus sp. BWR-S5 TaxID=2787714 RepID=UPI0019231569|nr:TIGR04197 family type VII secretion effector [Enterococcus sp. BWR-S5]
MGEVSTNSSIAGRLATDIFSSMDTLNSNLSVTKDSQSTVNGNTSAHEAIDDLSSMVQAVCSAIGTDANNLKSVAAEFEAADLSVRQMMSGPL